MTGRSPIFGGVGMSRIGIVSLFALLLSLQCFGVLSQGGPAITDPVETQALLAFKSALQDPDKKLSTWTQTTDPCLYWAGVICESTTSQGNTTFFHVTELRMFTWNLRGKLVPELGNLTFILTLDVMWNQLTGGIPAELGNLASLEILSLSGNNFGGQIPPSLGQLTKMNRIQLDENNFVGPIPTTFGNLTSLAHLHINNNSLSGTIPKELGNCPNLIHILVDNNQLISELPPEIANATTLVILQFDNNQIFGQIPENYTTHLTSLTKLSCRNCNLSGSIPDLTGLEHLYVVDLSHNELNGTIPDMNMKNLTSVDFSYNKLVGPLPSTLTTMSGLQSLVLSNNQLNSTIPDLGQFLESGEQLILDFQNNTFDFISMGLITGAAGQPEQIDLRLYGNPDICTGTLSIPAINTLCEPVFSTNFQSQGNVNDLPRGGPIVVQYRLKSPSFSYFTRAYEVQFTQYLASGLKIQAEQVSVQSFEWQPGPRLLMVILIDPPPNAKFNDTEVQRIEQLLSNWDASNSTLFGPYELLKFVFLGKNKKLSTGSIVGIVFGSVAFLVLCVLLLALFVLHKKGKKLTPAARRRAKLMAMKASQQSLIKITGVGSFSYKELAQATEDFSESKEVGRGGYGKVYRGVLESGQVVAIKRASLEAIQRNNEFYNEIELLSRCHHRNLVALVGYCNDHEEQMLVYEFMEGGTLHKNLQAEAADSMNFVTRLKIALGSAKGILYLHTEADPPIFHRDIKSNNILLDTRMQAKVADFGLSRLAPDFHDEDGVDNQSHVSTVVKGTPGYLDPEYFLTRKLTDKSDVYSFGVVLLELITGMQPISFGKNLVREVRGSYEEGEMWKVIDQKMGSYPSEIMDPFVTLAMSCVDHDTDARPTMKEVTRTLETLLINTQGKGAMTDMLSMDTAKEDFSVQLEKKEIFDGNFPGLESTGFDTGSSQTSKITDTPESTANFINDHRKDNVSPR